MGDERSASVNNAHSPLRFEHAVLDAVAFAAIPGVLQHAYAGVASQLNRVVHGAIVHHHYLREIPLGRAEILPHLYQ